MGRPPSASLLHAPYCASPHDSQSATGVSSPQYRRGVAEALVTTTCALLPDDLTKEEAGAIRSALFNWGFNTRQRGRTDQPDDVAQRLALIAARTPPVADVARPDTLRKILDALATRLDGKPAAGRTTSC